MSEKTITVNAAGNTAVKQKLDRKDARNLTATGFAALASGGLSYSLIQTFISFIYTEYLGVPAAGIGMVLSVGIIIDGVTDFLMGIVMDRVHSKLGKVRPWFLWMCIPLGLTCALIFYAPSEASVSVKLAYAFVMYNLYCTFLTAIRLPGQSMVSICFKKPRARQLASMISGLTNQLGSTISTTLITPLVILLGGELAGYRNTSIVFAICTVAAMLVTFALIKEPSAVIEQNLEDRKKINKQRGQTWNQIKMLLKNKYWLILEISVISNGFAGGCLVGTMAYFCNYVLGDVATVGIMAAVLSFGMLIGIFASTPFIMKYDARNISIFGSLLSAAGYLLAIVGFYAFHSSFWLYAGLGVKQFGTGFIVSVDLDMASRTVDYGEWKNGVRQDGMAFSGKGVVNKIATAAMTALIGFVLTSTGYVGGEGTIPTAALNTIQIIFLFVPAVMFVISAIAFYCFKLTDKQVAMMREEVRQRNEAAGKKQEE